MSVVVAPLELFGGLVFAPQVANLCATTTTIPVSTTVAMTCASVGSCAGWQNNRDGRTADPHAVWGCDESSISGADGLAIGTGAKNTTNILAGCSDAGIAADLADDYSHNTLNDCYAPSKDELNQM